ncbi:MAG: hypothetical protein ABF267_00160 [Glaciecola sp.]|jgi:hypothetical protein
MTEECDIEELHYRLYVLEKIKRGQDAIAQAQTLSHEEGYNIGIIAIASGSQLLTPILDNRTS